MKLVVACVTIARSASPAYTTTRRPCNSIATPRRFMTDDAPPARPPSNEIIIVIVVMIYNNNEIIIGQRRADTTRTAAVDANRSSSPDAAAISDFVKLNSSANYQLEYKLTSNEDRGQTDHVSPSLLATYLFTSSLNLPFLQILPTVGPIRGLPRLLPLLLSISIKIIFFIFFLLFGSVG